MNFKKAKKSNSSCALILKNTSFS